MVAPTTGILKRIIDEMAVQLDTVDNLRVYKATNQTAVAEYRSTSPEGVYNLEVLVLVDQADEQEAFEELEKYISADSPSSVKTLMDNTVVSGVQAAECIKAEPRRRYRIGGASLWGSAFWIRNIAT